MSISKAVRPCGVGLVGGEEEGEVLPTQWRMVSRGRAPRCRYRASRQRQGEDHLSSSYTTTDVCNDH